jgi:hypothetical protein
MKTFFVVCLALAAFAEPEADPQLFYNSPYLTTGLRPIQPLGLGVPLTYISPKVQEVLREQLDQVKDVEITPEMIQTYRKEKEMIFNPLVYSTGQHVLPYYQTSPIVQKTAILPTYAVKNGDIQRTVVKREADAQWIHGLNPFGVNPLYYSSIYNSHLVRPVVISPKVVTNDRPSSVEYASKGTYDVDSFGARHIAKREADAQWTYGLNHFGVNPLHYSSIYSPLVRPVMYTSPIVQSKTVSNVRSPLTPDYAAKGTYDVDSIGARHIAKREADAQFIHGLNPFAVNPLYYSSLYNPLVRPVMYTSPIVQSKTVNNVRSDLTVDYAGKGTYDVDSVGARHIAKREADAQWMVNPLMYNSMYSPLVAPVVRPVVYTVPKVVDPLQGVEAKTYANHFNPLGRHYASKGMYVADSVGARHVAKREAESDPALIYSSNIYGTPLRSSLYNYGIHSPINTLPFRNTYAGLPFYG